jgi:hypothetical protein
MVPKPLTFDIMVVNGQARVFEATASFPCRRFARGKRPYYWLGKVQSVTEDKIKKGKKRATKKNDSSKDYLDS